MDENMNQTPDLGGFTPKDDTASPPPSAPVPGMPPLPPQPPMPPPPPPPQDGSYQYYPPQQQPPLPPQPPVYPPQVPRNNDKKGMAIGGMICGIASIVLMCIPYLPIPCAIVGIILSILGLKSSAKGMAIAGIICSGIGIVISIIWLIVGTALLAYVGSDFSSYGYYY